MLIFSLVADNMLFLYKRKREVIFSGNNVPYAKIDRGTAACEAGMLPTELPHQVFFYSFVY